MSLDEVSKHYDELLGAGFFQSTLGRLREAETNPNLLYHDRLCVDVLRPCFVTAAQYRALQQEADEVVAALTALYRGLPRSVALQELLSIDPAMLTYHRGSATDYGAMWQRLDGLLDEDGRARYVELNTRPGGTLQNELLLDLYDSMPIMEAVRRRYRATPVRTTHHVRAALRPRVPASPQRSASFAAILGALPEGQEEDVDFTESLSFPLLDEPALTADWFAREGGTILVGHLDQFAFRNGRLLLHDRPVDVVVPHDPGLLFEGPDHPVHRAMAAGAARFVTDYLWEVAVSTKAIFEALSNPEYSELIGRDRFRLIQANIPWTRRVYERETEHEGVSIDLVPFVLSRREQLVLKPCIGTNGTDVVLGWEATDAQWAATLERALAGSYVVQQRVPAEAVSHPIAQNGELTFVRRTTDYSPFVWDASRTDGALIRMSSSASGISNLGAGGTKTALFVVD